MSEFERWFDDHLFYFPPELRVSGYEDLEIEIFYRKVYCNVKRELSPAIRQLMGVQYPTILKETRPAILAEINSQIEYTGYLLLFRLFEQLYDERQGVNFRVKYPKFEEWIDFYARPDKPHTLKASFFDELKWLTEEQKQEMIENDRKEAQEIFDWSEGRKRAFYDLVQPILFKYYSPLLELSPDGWIIYAVNMREEYESYRHRFDHLDTFVEYEFDVEDLDMPYSEFIDKLGVKMEKERELRDSASNSTE